MPRTSRNRCRLKFMTFMSIFAVLPACHDGENRGASSSGGGSDVVVNPCDSSQDMCLSSDEVLHCVDGQRIREYCQNGDKCFDGVCAKISCEPRKIESCSENGKYYGCNAVGTGKGEFDCDNGMTCVDGACVARLCETGAGQCLDARTILLCNEAGTAYTQARRCEDLKPKTVCEAGRCIPICDQYVKEASYIGCEYWAVDLDNAIDGGGTYNAAGQPFAVVLSNTHETLTANVEIYTKESGRTVKSLAFELKPKDVQSVYLPNQCYDGGGTCQRAFSVNGTTITDTAYRIRSDLPITAAQFNPLNNENVFSNDASLLFPTTALGRRYMVMARQQHYDNFHGFVTVVATQPGQTQVTIEASCRYMGGIDQSGNTVYAMNRGDSQKFYLNQFDILNLETLEIGEDPTGTKISADKDIAVFAGNEATSIPETDPVTCCADHIEHQQYPLSAWGKYYHAVKLRPRGSERDAWRILARADGTVVKTVPNVFKTETLTLNAGQWYDILTTESFEIEASAPILVGQFMTGQNDPVDPETGAATPESANIGDPSYILGVPIEQYRSVYQFLVPRYYKNDYVTIVAPVGAKVVLDGVEIAQEAFFVFGSGKYMASYQTVGDGRHDISADRRIGLFSYGYDDYVSYGYAAGLDLKDLFDED